MSGTTAPKTIVVYDLAGQNTFNIPFEYLARKFITVTLLGVTRKTLILGTDYRFVSKTVINIFDASPVGFNKIEIRRNTSATERLVDFYDGSILRANDLNLSQIQTLHVAEEARDLAGDSIAADDNGDLDARNRKIVNLGKGVLPTDAVNLAQLTETDQSTLNNANKAAASAAAAKTSETNAKTSETKAKESETKAKTSETNAKTSEDKAKVSETNAKTSETNAKTSETNAKASEVAAAASAVAAKASENTVNADRVAAQQSETKAKTSETNAKASETNAKTSETNAKASEDKAKVSETNAKNSETLSAQYRDTTQQYMQAAIDAAEPAAILVEGVAEAKTQSAQALSTANTANSNASTALTKANSVESAFNNRLPRATETSATPAGWVKVANVFGSFAASGDALSFHVTGGSEFGDNSGVYSAYITVVERGNTFSALVNTLTISRNTDPVFWFRRVADFTYEIWMQLNSSFPHRVTVSQLSRPRYASTEAKVFEVSNTQPSGTLTRCNVNDADYRRFYPMDRTVGGTARTVYSKDHGAGIGSINNTNNSPDAWNNLKPNLKMQSNNNAMVFFVSGVQNERNGFINVGPTDSEYANVSGVLRLQPFGGSVVIADRTTLAAGGMSFTRSSNGTGQVNQIQGLGAAQYMLISSKQSEVCIGNNTVYETVDPSSNTATVQRLDAAQPARGIRIPVNRNPHYYEIDASGNYQEFAMLHRGNTAEFHASSAGGLSQYRIILTDAIYDTKLFTVSDNRIQVKVAGVYEISAKMHTVSTPTIAVYHNTTSNIGAAWFGGETNGRYSEVHRAVTVNAGDWVHFSNANSGAYSTGDKYRSLNFIKIRKIG